MLAFGNGFRPKGRFRIQDHDRGSGGHRDDLVPTLDASVSMLIGGSASSPDTDKQMPQEKRTEAISDAVRANGRN